MRICFISIPLIPSMLITFTGNLSYLYVRSLEPLHLLLKFPFIIWTCPARYVKEKRKMCWGLHCCDQGRESKTVPYDKITDCDVQETLATPWDAMGGLPLSLYR